MAIRFSVSQSFFVGLTVARCKTFADFLSRVAVAIKAKGFLRQGEELHNGAWGYDSTDHIDMDAPAMRWFVESNHRAYIKKLYGEEKAA